MKKDNKIYIYEKKDKFHHYILGVKQSYTNYILDKFAYILEWFSIGYLFYLNNIYIESKLFSIFIFIMGLILVNSTTITVKCTTKQEFLKKIIEILTGDTPND